MTTKRQHRKHGPIRQWYSASLLHLKNTGPVAKFCSISDHLALIAEEMACLSSKVGNSNYLWHTSSQPNPKIGCSPRRNRCPISTSATPKNPQQS